MICIDTSSVIAYLEGAEGSDVDLVDQVLSDQVGVFSPVTITELLSEPKLLPSLRLIILQLPVLPILGGYWERAGTLRAKAIKRGRKARLADVLIAQNCLDHHASLITRDDDFKILKEVGGLRIL